MRPAVKLARGTFSVKLKAKQKLLRKRAKVLEAHALTMNCTLITTYSDIYTHTGNMSLGG